VRQDLAGLDFAGFAAWCRGLVGFHDRFHRALYRRLMADGIWDPMTEPVWAEAERSRPGTLAALASAAASRQIPEVVAEHTAHDPVLGETRKLALRLVDGRDVEAVLIPMGGGPERGGHYTVCVSSQVGCKMGCTFCHTATMGLVRQLAAHEIVGQVLAVQARTGRRPRNVVFMGMGEPLDNLDAVAQAVRVLTDVCGLAIAFDHITVSTVGRVDGIERLPELGLDRINLAISLSAPDDELRSRLMPVNRVYDLARLRAALVAFPLRPGRKFLISYVLIAGTNDAPEQAAALARWCAGMPVLVNLIPWNPIPGSSAQTASPARMADFHAELRRAGVQVRQRQTKGDAVMAACGQLGDPAQRKRRPG
jgi:23S rRNA (adenine2503-C2)-methyltransferase